MFRSGRLRWRQGKRVWGYTSIDISTFLSPNSQKNAYAATAAVHLINTRVVAISRGNKGKTPWFRTKVSVCLSQAAKYDRSRYKQTTKKTLIVIFSPYLLIIDRWLKLLPFYLLLNFVNKSSFPYALIPTTSILVIEIGDQSFRGVDCLIVTRIYDSRWRVISWSCLSANGWSTRNKGTNK